MDIKNILNAVIPQSIRGKEKVERTIKTDSTTDRDANGQMFTGGDERHHPPMTDEQLKKSIEHLLALPVVKENNLSVEPCVVNGKKFLLLKEASGKIVRRIPEEELWSLMKVGSSEKGQLLRKTA